MKRESTTGASDGQRYPMPQVSVGLSLMVRRAAAPKGLLTYIFVDLEHERGPLYLGEGPWTLMTVLGPG